MYDFQLHKKALTRCSVRWVGTFPALHCQNMDSICTSLHRTGSWKWNTNSPTPPYWSMDVGEKIMESWAVPGVQSFGTHADDKAKGAALCLGTRREGCVPQWAPWTTACQLKHRAADSHTFSFVSVAGHSQACVTVEAHPETSWGPGCCLQHCYVIALGHATLFLLHEILPDQRGHAFQVTQMSGKHPTLTGAPGRTQPQGQTWCSCGQPHSGRAQLPCAIWVPRTTTEEQGDNETQSLLRPSVRRQRGLCMCVLAAWSWAWEMRQPWQPEHAVPHQAPAGLCTHPYCSPPRSATIYPWIN